MNRHSLLTIATLTLAIVTGPPARSQGQNQGLDAWLAAIESQDDGVRMAARLSGEKHGARAVAGLGKIIGSGHREAKITAQHALKRIVHHAGRPGAASERAPVLRELEKLTAPELAAGLRREALWMIGFIGGDKPSVEVAYRSLWDDDEHVAEIARLVLERMPGGEAVGALRTAIVLANDDKRSDLIFSLSKKGDASAVPVLVKLSGALHPQVRLAAFEGLARLGAPEGVAPFTAALADADDPLHAKLFNEYLRLADLLSERGDADQGRAMYLDALARAPHDFQRERALHRLCPEGNDSGIEALFTGLTDSAERVRRLALGRLAALRGSKASAALEKGYEEAPAATRPILLRALAERERDAAAEHIRRAIESDDAELGITARDLAGELDQV